MSQPVEAEDFAIAVAQKQAENIKGALGYAWYGTRGLTGVKMSFKFRS